MNAKQPPRRAIAAIAASLFVFACAEPEAFPMQGSPIGGDFALTDAAGNIVSNDSLQGSWRLVYFGYTFCPDVCPLDAERLGRAYRQLETSSPAVAERLVPMFISVDPERDTPDIAGEFAANFHPKMLGLSGTPEAVQQAVDAYRIYAAKGEAREDGFYLVDHSAYIYLMDPGGRPVNIYARDVGAEQIAEDVERWMTS